jgi:5-methylthioribose kinase
LSDIRVPAVRFEDTTNHVILIECAPSRAVSWKKQLLDGRVDPGIAETLGRFLGKTHEGVADDPGLKEVFSHDAPFEQLRLDPYHRTVAERHLSVASLVHSELDRARAVNDTLVHGDFSPKNVLIDHRLGSMTIWLLDFKVAHWGDPAFDTAFMLNHLLIKSVYLKAEQEAYLEAARRFWHAYSAQVEQPTIGPERHVPKLVLRQGALRQERRDLEQVAVGLEDRGQQSTGARFPDKPLPLEVRRQCGLCRLVG